MKANKILLFLILFLVLFISIFVYLSLNPYVLYMLKGERDFNDVIIEVDGYLLNGNLEGAEKIIRFYSYYADTEYKWLSLIKRAKLYSDKIKHYLLMRDILELSVKSLPGNLKLRALEVYSKLKVGAVLEAYDIAKQYLLGYKEYKHLYDEAFMKSLILSYDIKDIKKLSDKNGTRERCSCF
ncbi:Putative cytosolic protein [Borrelia nietonii YOR]|uniref:Cytosolic protein n=1 Tax=Borrelia nietonii YOR TaxID=1293576 RepID=A0ABM5PHF3_9SPIR|nr:Putative cytosolic protein [Borrelia nietonii YOR]